MRMRSLSLLLLSALCCFPFGSAWAATGFYLNTEPDSFFTTALLACERYLPEFKAAHPLPSWPNAVYYVGSSQPCTYGASKSAGGSSLMSGFPWTVNGVNASAKLYECKVNEADSFTWPRGKAGENNDVIAGTEVPIYSDANLCVNGCIVTTPDPSPTDCFIDSTNLFCTWAVKKSGPTCQLLTKAPEQSSGCPSGYELSGGACVALPPVDPCIDNPTGPGCTPPVDPCVANPSGPGCTPPVDPCVANPSGAGCPGGGTDPGDGTDPGGGTTPGTGTGPGTGTQPTPGSAGGLACGDVFSCSGDSVACATAQLEKIQMCESKRGNDYAVAGQTAIAEALKDPDGDLEESEVHLASIISGHVRFLPSTCPPAQSFTVFGRQFAFKNDLFCNFATSMSWLVVAMASLTAAMYIGQSFGSS